MQSISIALILLCLVLGYLLWLLHYRSTLVPIENALCNFLLVISTNFKLWSMLCKRRFSVAAPSVWNSLPLNWLELWRYANYITYLLTYLLIWNRFRDIDCRRIKLENCLFSPPYILLLFAAPAQGGPVRISTLNLYPKTGWIGLLCALVKVAWS